MDQSDLLPLPRVDVASAIPGLHIVANFRSSTLASEKCRDFNQFKLFIDEEIIRLNLSKVGEAYHNFPGGGFTGVIALTESHLSVHTWPELDYITFDVFLSNHLKDNRITTEKVYQSVTAFFDARILFEQKIDR